MTNTKVNKCKAIACTHSGSYTERNHIVNNRVVRKHNQKWHFCNVCDKVVHLDYIAYHEMKCESFRELQKNCIAKDHYALGFHSEGVACNM
jgi:hypothetical protein